MAPDRPALVADALVDRLLRWGIGRVFGYSGDGIDPILAAIARRGGDLELVTARHEESAALMATGHAKWTGATGCCLATHGPGAIHLLNGLYDAKLDKRPVVAIIAQQHRTAIGSGYQQEIDAASLFKDVCGAYLATVTTPEQLHLVVDRAVRTAQARRQPTGVILPHDVQQMEVPAEPPHAHAAMATSVGWSPPRVTPDDDALDAAVAVLDAGERIAIVAGQGAARAGEELAAVAERLGAGVAKALLGMAVLPDDLPYVTGPIGHLGSTASDLLARECDTLLLVGTNEPYTEHLPAPGQARAVQIDIDGANLGARYPTEVNLCGDAGETLRALLPRLAARDRSGWRARVEAAVAEWWEILDRRAHRDAEPLNPQLLFHELSPRLPDDALLAVDVGSTTYWYARHIRVRGTMAGHLSSTLASMGSALPYAVAAKLAHPGRLVVALAGDGAMQMNGINELITVARLWEGWDDPRLPILVLDNGDLAEVTWEQREMEGDPRFPASQAVTPVPYAEWARLLGLDGTVVDDPAAVGPAWDRALAADRPFLVHARVDPAVPLTPPRYPTGTDALLAGLDQETGPVARRACRLVLAELEDQGEAPPS
ncbi:MAG TPA: thiamine pyrophosphate-requiring protein [Iamia sp.]|nr:thiamine pyrophosphate-requiring protein [Iamia sp.]